MYKIFVLDKRGDSMSDLWDTQGRIYFMGHYWVRINGKMTLPLKCGDKSLTQWHNELNDVSDILNQHGCQFRELSVQDYAASLHVPVQRVEEKVLPMAQ